jgi:hypothetical protein
MTAPFAATYEDVLVMMKQFISARVLPVGGEESVRYAVEAALREVIALRDWNCLRRCWRVPLVAPQSDGTATYQASGGAYPYLVTLSGATVPTWAADAQFRLGDNALPCDVDQIISTTQFTLRSPRVPEADASGATYKLGKSWYALPAEFAAAWSPGERNAWCVGRYITFEDWHLYEKYGTLTGTTRYWTIGPAPNRLGTMALYISPYPNTATEYDFVMKCKPRRLAVTGQDAWNCQGTVTCTSGSATVVGAATAFKSIVAGSIIRFSDSATVKPTGSNGPNPYVFQQTISTVDTEAQTLTLGYAAPVSLAGVRYVISDPIDLDECIYDAFLRCCEKQLAQTTGMKGEDLRNVKAAYDMAVIQARMNDNKTRGIVVPSPRRARRLSDGAILPAEE